MLFGMKGVTKRSSWCSWVGNVDVLAKDLFKVLALPVQATAWKKVLVLWDSEDLPLQHAILMPHQEVTLVWTFTVSTLGEKKQTFLSSCYLQNSETQDLQLGGRQSMQGKVCTNVDCTMPGMKKKEYKYFDSYPVKLAITRNDGT